MALYQDPDGPRLQPALIPALMSIPATAAQHQHENQATAVLAWLADRSSPFARRLVELFTGSAELAGSVQSIGARAQLSLPRPSGGTVFPDFSLDGADRAFQVLVEVKVGSEFGVHSDEHGQPLLQQDAYRQAWEALPPDGEARVRAVATLTRDGGGVVPDLGALRGRDASWREVRLLLDELLVADAFAPEVVLVAASFRDAIAAQIAIEPVDRAGLAAWKDAHRLIVQDVVAVLARELRGTVVQGGSGSDYVGSRVRLLDAVGAPLIVRVYATPAGGRLNVGGWGDAVIAVLERDVDGNLDPASAEAARAAGFKRLKDIDSFWMHRAMWPLENAHARGVAAELVERVRRTGLLPR